MERVTFGAFSLDVPSDWTMTTVILAGPVEACPPDVYLLLSSDQVHFQRNLVITLEQVNDTVTLGSYVQRQREGLLKAGVSFYQKAPPEPVKLDSGFDGLLTEQAIQGTTGVLVCQMQLVCIKNG